MDRCERCRDRRGETLRNYVADKYIRLGPRAPACPARRKYLVLGLGLGLAAKPDVVVDHAQIDKVET